MGSPHTSADWPMNTADRQAYQGTRQSPITRIFNHAQIRAVLINLLVCALLLIPDVFVRMRDGLGWAPDLITMLVGAVLFVMACTHNMLFRASVIPFLLLNATYLHVASTWGPSDLSARVEVVLEAPVYEAVEYVRGFVGLREVKLTAYVLVCLLGLFVTRPVVMPRGARVSLPLLCVAALVIACSVNPAALMSHPYSALLLAYNDARARYERMESRRVFLEQLPASQAQCSEDYENVLIVLGESASRSHMSLYGYSKRTTPFLESIQPFTFEALAASNQTRLSIPLMLTDATIDHYAAFFSLPSLVSELRACGYETFWISNQGRTGMNDSANGSIGKEAHHFWPREGMGARPDGVLIPRLREALARPGSRKAVFIHLIGSHLVYRHRYPLEFPKQPLKDIVAQYDETIRYTDFVLSQMYGLFPLEGFLFIYVSDHAELVRNSDAGTYEGHGYSPAYKAEYQIPLVAWSSSPEKLQSLKTLTQGRQINMDCFAELVRYLLGMAPSPNLSFSRKVLGISETTIADYDRLKD